MNTALKERPQMAQINVRIAKTLKDQGDAALEELDISPSDAIRALWSAMAKRGTTRAQAVAVLSDADADTSRESRRARHIAAVERMAARYADLGANRKAGDLPELDEDGWDELAWEDYRDTAGRGSAL